MTDADGVLRALDWEEYEPRMKELLRLQYGAVALKDARSPAEIRAALTDYFKGDLDRLNTIKWRVAGTPFQRKVWTALPKIPAGTTMSYGALAAQLGMPKAMRAVGHANGSNPLSVVVPCHRLIGANGSLVKYGGGLERKRWLLAARGRGARTRRSRHACSACFVIARSEATKQSMISHAARWIASLRSAMTADMSGP